MNLSTFVQIGQIIPKNIISDAIRTIFMAFDSATFSIIALLFEMVFSIVKLDQLTVITSLYDEIQNKAYVIIGVYMIFKVILSLLTYFANPDKINDKEIGGAKLVTRIVISLVLLIIVPTIVFPFLSDIQIPLVNTVGKIITNNVTSIDDNSFLNEGQEAAVSLMSTFFYADSECIAGSSVEDYKIDSIIGTVDLVNLPCESSSGTDKSKYMYTYVFGVSNIVSSVAAILLIIIAVNVAIRVFKLMILKILAPIPILSYIEPKSAKDGMLASYTKLFMKTYLDLFVQFGVFYLVMLLIGRLYPGTGEFLLTTTEHVAQNPISVFSFPFIFLGLLIFAIMAPKFIKKALNIKDSEFGTGIAGMLTTGAILAGATGSAVSGFATSKADGKSFLQNFGAGIAGAIGGAATGTRVGLGSGKTDYSKVLSSISDRNTRARANADAGVSMNHRLGNWFGSTFMGQSPFERQREIVEGYEVFAKTWDSVSSALKSEATKGKYGYASFEDKVYGYGNIEGKSKDFAGAARAAEAAGKTTVEYTDSSGNTHTYNLAHASYIQAELEKAETASMFKRLLAGDSSVTDGNPELVEAVNGLRKDFETSGISTITGGTFEQAIGSITDQASNNYKNLDDHVKQVKAESTRIKHSTEYMAAQAAAKKK